MILQPGEYMKGLLLVLVKQVSGAGATCKEVLDFFWVGSSHDCSSSAIMPSDTSRSLSDYLASGPVFSMLLVLRGQWLESRLLVLLFPVRLCS